MCCCGIFEDNIAFRQEYIEMQRRRRAGIDAPGDGGTQFTQVFGGAGLGLNDLGDDNTETEHPKELCNKSASIIPAL